jgi:predicted benzoate:H+ symporter BenE
MQDMFCFAMLADAITGTMYTNITGAFPVRSFKSMQYVFVAYIYDLNPIVVRAMPSCTNVSMVQAFIEFISILKSGGYHPALNVMDKECSDAVKKYIRSKAINIQLVPPHNH